VIFFYVIKNVKTSNRKVEKSGLAVGYCPLAFSCWHESDPDRLRSTRKQAPFPTQIYKAGADNDQLLIKNCLPDDKCSYLNLTLQHRGLFTPVGD